MTVPVTVFDLDGTLTRRDTSLGFLRFVAGGRRLAEGVVRAGLGSCTELVRAWRGERGGGGVGGVGGRWEALLHQRVMAATLVGRNREELEEAGNRFAERIVADRLRDGARERIRAHRDAGERLVLASASLELYVAPLARLLGIDAAVATRAEFVGGKATGRILGLPCWGTEKLRRVRAVLAPGEEIVRAYGDNPGDAELLAAAREAVWVSGNPFTRPGAVAPGRSG